jgi:hypothetical protein
VNDLLALKLPVKRRNLATLILVSWLFTACAWADPTPMLTVTQTPFLTTAPALSRTPSPTLTITTTPIPSTAQAILIPSYTPTTTVMLPSGLVYVTERGDCNAGNGTWLVGLDGEPNLVVNQRFASLSPTRLMALYHDCDGSWISNLVTGEIKNLSERAEGFNGEYRWSSDGKLIYYIWSDDIWVTDLQSGERRNLTNTPDRDEYDIHIWDARPDVIWFYSQDKGIEAGEGWFGYPTIIRSDGTQVLSLLLRPLQV